jgi:hypothetical protein
VNIEIDPLQNLLTVKAFGDFFQFKYFFVLVHFLVHPFYKMTSAVRCKPPENVSAYARFFDFVRHPPLPKGPTTHRTMKIPSSLIADHSRFPHSEKA